MQAVQGQTTPATGPGCKAFPGSPDWPAGQEWRQLNQSLGGALLPPGFPASACYAEHDYEHIAPALQLRGDEHVVDAGGGLGVLARALIRAHPAPPQWLDRMGWLDGSTPLSYIRCEKQAADLY